MGYEENSRHYCNSRQCCKLRRELAEAFATAARLYSESAVLLTTLVASETGFAHRCKLTHEAQRRSEEAFALYEEHVSSHSVCAERPQCRDDKLCAIFLDL